MPSMEQPSGEYGSEQKALEDFKKIILMVAGGAVKMQMDGQLNLKEEQEVLMNVADMLSDVFLAESMLLRVQLLSEMGKNQSQDQYKAMLQVFFHDVTARMHKNATDALASFAEGDLLRTFLMGLKRYTKYPAVNVKAARRRIAQTLISADAYCF